MQLNYSWIDQIIAAISKQIRKKYYVFSNPLWEHKFFWKTIKFERIKQLMEISEILCQHMSFSTWKICFWLRKSKIFMRHLLKQCKTHTSLQNNHHDSNFKMRTSNYNQDHILKKEKSFIFTPRRDKRVPFFSIILFVGQLH